MELGQLIREQFHLKTTIPQWKEKKTLFASEEIVMPEKVMPEEGRQEISPSPETLSHLFRHLDRNYKRLRRKLRNMRPKGKEIQDPRLLAQLEEINKRLEELESEL